MMFVVNMNLARILEETLWPCLISFLRRDLFLLILDADGLAFLWGGGVSEAD